MKSSSLKLIDAGIKEPAKYRDALIHSWYLPDEYSAHLEVYIQRETLTYLFFTHIQHGELSIAHKKYSITFIQPINKLKQYKRLLISIRYCRDLDRGYALVKGLDSGQFENLVYGDEVQYGE